MKKFVLNSNWGNTFDDVALKAKSLTNIHDVVEFEFNGVKCLVNKETDLKLLYRDYSNSWTMEWKEVGPYCREEYSEDVKLELKKRNDAKEEKQRLDEIEHKKKEDKARSEFEKKVEGVEMEFSDKAAWDRGIEKNKDPYGACIYEYSKGWAKIMQVEIAQGKTLVECAEKASFELSFLGITGFMYGAAVSVLSHCWKHGEELRKWHNKEYKHEGEGVVNPAIITIG